MQVIQNQQTLEKFREFFTGESEGEVTQKMDRRAQEVEPKGYTVVKRRKIGRNEACPCGSGVKFKKCCIDQAR